ncbi:phosphotransferase [Mycolicibacterium sp. P1-18]|uniref:phosphotransferase n=1 Tax=Mycolicibacterium sp. P1-18 TaxID=2024615 RepID=UPI001564F65B|nr:phosphotransferase [Mycolicibacterium sp. P1-18]
MDAGPGDTRNVFHLPPLYHYGVGAGSTGFNAWREVAMHQMASEWVLDGASPAFPLLYHWRLLREVPSGLGGAPIEPTVAFWAGSPHVEERLRALATSRTVVVLFVEHLPWTLRNHLDAQLSSGTARERAAYLETVLDQLLDAVACLQAHGVVHFDAHLDNVMTTGRQVVVTDFGLAAAATFQLDDAERQFLTAHSDHDAAYCIAELTNAVLKIPGVQTRSDELPEELAKIVRRMAPTAAAMNGFYRLLHDGHLQTQFPSQRLAITLAALESD